jgi:primosomal protein N' (replication factor Y)
VAEHNAGGVADGVRLAIPPRHAATEKAEPTGYPKPELPADGYPDTSVLGCYPHGESFLAALRRGVPARAAWTAAAVSAPIGDWVNGFIAAAQATLLAGKSALLLVPDRRDLDRLSTGLTESFGKGSFVALHADIGPAARYRRFLAAKRGGVRIVAGTRAAAFTPLPDLGLIALWDDGDDSYAELRAPYPHTREIAALRAHLAKSALILGGYARTPEVQQLVDHGWLPSLELPPAAARQVGPRVVAAAEPEENRPLERIPSDVFEAVRAAVAQGPVLLQVLHDVRRTAQELGRALPGIPVVFSSADHPLGSVSDEPQLVFATPNTEPPAVGGYAAAILLDADAMVRRADLRAAEEALRRWLAAAALVRPAADGGSVLVAGTQGERAVQAMLRLDPVGFAVRELADRRAAGFPPAVKLVMLEASYTALSQAVKELELPDSAELLGPLPTANPDVYRVTLRAPLSTGAQLVQAVRVMSSVRTARKAEAIHVEVDPHVVG